MPDSHSERFITKLLIGFASIIGGVFITYLAIFEEAAKKGQWYFFASVTAFLFCGGVYFCTQASIHKMKSDLHKRSRQREIQKSRSDDQI